MIRNASVYDIPRINELGKLLNKNFERLFKISVYAPWRSEKYVIKSPGN